MGATVSQKWIKSTYSEWSNCVEVSRIEYGVMIRDSKSAVSDVVMVEVSETAWQLFVSHAAIGRR